MRADTEAGLSPAQPILRFENVSAGYGRATVLRNVSLEIPRGGIVALLGPNGAGKTTLLRTAVGLLRPTAGAIHFCQQDITRTSPHQRAKDGLCLIPEGRGVFRGLTVRDNLRVYLPSGSRAGPGEAIDHATSVFPVLGKRLGQVAGTLSGGQQQMLALARSFLANPRVVLLDEVSMGLAPKVVDEIYDAIARLAKQGIALVLVEQYVTRALDLADTVVLLDRGTVAYGGPTTGLQDAAVLRGYLGVDLNAPDSSTHASSLGDGQTGLE
jgi:branched-chain amino acid transport system ATP-binding protein